VDWTVLKEAFNEAGEVRASPSANIHPGGDPFCDAANDFGRRRERWNIVIGGHIAVGVSGALVYRGNFSGSRARFLTVLIPPHKLLLDSAADLVSGLLAHEIAGCNALDIPALRTLEWPRMFAMRNCTGSP
jgi:hypothetical protein